MSTALLSFFRHFEFLSNIFINIRETLFHITVHSRDVVTLIILWNAVSVYLLELGKKNYVKRKKNL